MIDTVFHAFNKITKKHDFFSNLFVLAPHHPLERRRKD
jgi:hypothetical protein